MKLLLMKLNHKKICHYVVIGKQILHFSIIRHNQEYWNFHNLRIIWLVQMIVITLQFSIGSKKIIYQDFQMVIHLVLKLLTWNYWMKMIYHYYWQVHQMVLWRFIRISIQGRVSFGFIMESSDWFVVNTKINRVINGMATE